MAPPEAEGPRRHPLAARRPRRRLPRPPAAPQPGARLGPAAQSCPRPEAAGPPPPPPSRPPPALPAPAPALRRGAGRAGPAAAAFIRPAAAGRFIYEETEGAGSGLARATPPTALPPPAPVAPLASPAPGRRSPQRPSPPRHLPSPRGGGAALQSRPPGGHAARGQRGRRVVVGGNCSPACGAGLPARRGTPSPAALRSLLPKGGLRKRRLLGRA